MATVSWMVVGLITGWLVGMILKGGDYGIASDILFGIVGGLVGGFCAMTFLGANATEIDFASLAAAAVGALSLVVASRIVVSRRRAAQ